MFFTGAQAMQNMASGASDLTEELSEIAGEVIHSDLLFNERTVTILGIALVLMLWRIVHGVRKGMVYELLHMAALVLSFICIYLGVRLLQWVLLLIPWEVPTLTALLVGDETLFPSSVEGLWSYIPSLTGFLKLLPSILIRLFFLTLAIRVIRFLRGFFDFVQDVPVVGGLDRFLGGIIGAVEGLAILLLALYILGVPVGGLLTVLAGLWQSCRILLSEAVKHGVQKAASGG
ncbi:MAG: CvpA family protein [Butyrivibrio sp.]|nr:CvpA family protein [Butyrivibrio sp.]